MDCNKLNINTPEATILYNLKKNHFELAELVFISLFEDNNLKLFNSKMDEELYYPCNNGKIILQPNENLENNQYYEVTLNLCDFEERQNADNPFLLKISNQKKIGNKEDVIKYFIEKIYKTHHYSDYGGNLESLLQNYKKEMYSNDERFIYELLQNADDIPIGDYVEVKFDIADDFFYFLHTGKQFDFADVYSITSTGQSTKGKNGAKTTGYKGIGFKSVFSEGDIVYIKSGDFYFKFDNNADIHEDIANNLWELKPILVSENEIEIKDLNNNVNIVLKLKKSNTEYYNYLNKIFSKFQFILFLRNTTFVEYPKQLIDNNIKQIIKEQIKVEKTDINKTIEIKNIFVNNEKKANFLITKYADIPIPEETQNEFRKDDELPEKMKTLTSIEISLANEIDKNSKLDAVKKSTIFAYLPTNDTKYEIPFLANSSFILNSSRELVDTSKSFNHFIFYTIGYYSIQRIKDILEANTENQIKFSYSIAPRKLENEDNENNKNKENFNKGFEEAIKFVRFIQTIEKDELKKCNEVIIDKTGFAKHIGTDIFYSISGTQLRLVNSKIDIRNIEHSDYNIEKFVDENLLEKLKINSVTFNNWIKEVINYDELIEKIDKHFIKETSTLKDTFFSLDIFKFAKLEEDNFNFYSIDKLTSKDNYVVINGKNKSIQDQLKKIGFFVSICDFSQFENFSKLSQINELKDFYILQKSIIENNSNLDENDKLELAKFIKENYPKEISELKLFCKTIIEDNQNKDVVCKISELLVSDVTISEYWLNSYKIKPAEYEISKDIIHEYLIKTENVFSKTIVPNWNEIIKNILPINIKEFYVSVQKYYKSEFNENNKEQLTKLLKDDFKSKKFVYSIFGNFDSSENIYYHKDLKTNDYETLNTSIKKVIQKELPHIEIFPFLSEEPFKIENNKVDFKKEIEKHLKVNSLVLLDEKITSIEKIELFKFLEQIKEDNLQDFEIFTNNLNKTVSLSKAIASNFPNWLFDYKILESENLNGFLDKYCLTENQTYSLVYQNWDTIITKNETKNEIRELYAKTTIYYNKQAGAKTEKLSVKKDCPFIYVDEQEGFELLEGVFYHPNCLNAKLALEKITTNKLPSIDIIEYFEKEVTINSEKFESPFFIENTTSLIIKPNLDVFLTFKEVKKLIEFSIDANILLFSFIYLTEKGDDVEYNYHLCNKTTQIQFDTPDADFIEYIENNFSKKLFFVFPKTLRDIIKQVTKYSSIGIKTDLIEKIIDYIDIDNDNQISGYLPFVKPRFTNEYREQIKSLINKRTKILINPKDVSDYDKQFLEIALKTLDNE